MKLYFFIHSGLTGVYAGIQAGHSAVELMRKYTTDKFATQLPPKLAVKQTSMVMEWADSHKTFILLNGGLTSDLNRVKRLIRQTTELPWAEFREPDYGNMITAIALVVPDDWKPVSKGWTFYELLKNSKLAK